MSSAYATVSDYLADARVLLLDEIAPYRYDDTSLITALNVTLLEARRLRADLFVYATKDGKVPSYTTNNKNEVPIEEPFRLAMVHGLVGHALERDQEDIQDSRAQMFLKIFNRILVGRSNNAVNAAPEQQGAQ